MLGHWWQRAAIFPIGLMLRFGRKLAGSTVLLSKVGTGWAGACIPSTSGWRCATGVDRFTALVLASAYLLLLLDALLLVLNLLGKADMLTLSRPLQLMLLASFAGFVWRAGLRALLTTREYGWREGTLSVLRIPVANVIAIMAGRRALVAYFRSLQDGKVVWDKTVHEHHPATLASARAAPALHAVQS